MKLTDDAKIIAKRVEELADYFSPPSGAGTDHAISCECAKCKWADDLRHAVWTIELLAHQIDVWETGDGATNLEPFVVKHYGGDEGPTIKGNGFDGLRLGDDRSEADEFIAFVNDILSGRKGYLAGKRAGREDMRERAARACLAELMADDSSGEQEIAYNEGCNDCAAAIRALGVDDD